MDDISMLAKLTGESDEELLSLLLQLSEERLLALTNRTKMTPMLAGAKKEWALIAYNRMGMEGESSRSQGGITSAFVEIPAQISGVIQSARIARVGGKIHEKAKIQNEEVSVENISSA